MREFSDQGGCESHKNNLLNHTQKKCEEIECDWRGRIEFFYGDHKGGGRVAGRVSQSEVVVLARL